MNEKFSLINAEKAHHAVEFMAKMLKVSRAGYYAWGARRGTLATAQVRCGDRLSYRVGRD